MSNEARSHSAEPWCAESNESFAEICDADGRLIGDTCASSCRGDIELGKVNARRIVACVNAFAGIETDAIEGKTIAEFVASQTMLTGMNPDIRGGFTLQLEGGACHLLAEAFADQFKGSGAINFLEVNFTHPELGDMSVTMQRTSGKTPGQLKAEAVAQRDELLQTLRHIEGAATNISVSRAVIAQGARNAIDKVDLGSKPQTISDAHQKALAKLGETTVERNELLAAIGNLVGVIEKAGLNNLSNGVQLGQVSWFVKVTDAVEYAKAAIAKCEPTIDSLMKMSRPMTPEVAKMIIEKRAKREVQS